MHSRSRFHHVLNDLLKSWGIDLQKSGAENTDGYTVQVNDQVTIHLVGKQEDFLHLWCFPGALPEKTDEQVLIVLLAANRITFAYPHLNLGINPENRQLMLWTRQALNELDSVKIHQLFELFIETSEYIQQWVQQGTPLVDEHAQEIAPSIDTQGKIL